MKKLDSNRHKKPALILLLVTAIFIANTLTATQPNNYSNGNSTISEIISSMTLEQKAQLVVGTGMYFPLPDSIKDKMPAIFQVDDSEDTEYSRMVNKIRGYLPGTAGTTAEFPNVGITSQTLADGPAGLRISPMREGDDQTYYCTAFPIATLLASTWDTDLVKKVGESMGEEVLEYGADIILGPGMNIQRDPLCGRNFEYYSEDPLVTGKMAAAMVNGIQSNGVGTSIKHFAFNNQETNRLSVNTILSERAIREIYLTGFEIAVKESQPYTVMSSYNKVNGVYTSENHDLLTKILRDDWGFKGYVVTDWGGGSDIVAQMNAGNDMIMPGSSVQIESIINAVKEGKLEEKILDKNVERILTIMKKTPRNKGYKISNKPNLEAHAEVTRQAATSGMVLLKNSDNALPIKNSTKKVAAFGNTSYEFIAGGTGSGDVNEAYTVSLIGGLKNAGFEIDPELKEIYETFIKTERANAPKPKNELAALMGGMIPVAEMDVKAEMANELAKKTDIALITVGRNSGEGGDREAIEGDFYLTPTEKSMIKTVTEAFHKNGKKAIVILNIGGVIETASWREIPDAILCAWQAGQEGGNSVVDVITGKANPSGKLAITFPLKYDDVSSANNFPGYAIEGEKDDAADLSGFSFMQRVPWEVVYEEDIYVGYRYHSTFEVPVAYEFGYGLSYTTFDYSNLTLSSDKFNGSLTVSVDIKNTGKTEGKEVVQLYLGAPTKKMEKPAIELKRFDKTKLLKPGESQTVTFTLDKRSLASFYSSSSSWVADAGNYSVKIGASSKDIKLSGDFELSNDIVVEKVTKALTPQVDIKKLTKK